MKYQLMIIQTWSVDTQDHCYLEYEFDELDEMVEFIRQSLKYLSVDVEIQFRKIGN